MVPERSKKGKKKQEQLVNSGSISLKKNIYLPTSITNHMNIIGMALNYMKTAH